MRRHANRQCIARVKTSMHCVKHIATKKINKNRNIWTVVRGQSYGYISDFYTSGIFFLTQYITFNPSFHPYIGPRSCSISKLPHNCMDTIRDCHGSSVVKVEYSIDVVGSPLKGDLL